MVYSQVVVFDEITPILDIRVTRLNWRTTMTTATAQNRPYGLLYDHDPSISYGSLRADYSVPTIEDLRAAKEASRRENSRPLPENLGAKWQPIHHADWIEAVRTAAVELDLEVTAEKFSLSKDGHDLFGLFEFEGDVSGAPDDHVYKVFALRTSNMQRQHAEGRTGGRVSICANGIMTGAFMLGHKQTNQLNPVELVRGGFEKWVDQQRTLDTAVAAMKNRDLTDGEVYEIMGRAVIGAGGQKGFLGSAAARRIVAEYEQPRHEVFAARTGWSLYNASTEAMKHEKRMSNDTGERLQLGMARLIVPADVSLN